MKKHTIVALLFFIFYLLTPFYLFSQKITADTTLANKYLDLALKYENSSMLDSAIFYIKNAQVLNIKYLGENNLKNANLLHVLARIYFNNNNYNLALENNFKALKIRREYLGEKNNDVGRSYNNIANVYNDKGEYDNALEYYLKALRIFKETLGEKHTILAAIYLNIGNVYYYKGLNDKALDYYLKASQLYKDILGEDNPSIAMSYSNIGNVYNIKGEYDKALDYYQKSLLIRQKILGETHLDVGASLNNVGVAFYNKGEYKKALEYYQKALKIKIKNLGENHSDVALTYGNLGDSYKRIGEYDKALEYYLKALQIKIGILTEKHPDVAISYDNIGNVYFDKSKYKEALEFYLKALRIRIEILGEKNLDVAVSYDYIASIYNVNGEHDKALEYYSKALQIRREILGKDNLYVSFSYENIGNSYFYKNEYDKALEYNLKGLNIRKEILGEKHPDLASNYNSIGNVYRSKDEYDKALEYLLKALQINIEIIGEKHPMVASNYNDIGNVYWNKHEYDKALGYYFKSLKIRKEIFGEKHPDVATNYDNIGVVYCSKGDYEKALKYCQKGISSCIYDFSDTIDVLKTPVIKGNLNWKYLLQPLITKAEILADTNKRIPGLKNNDRRKIALLHFQACDTLMDLVRKEISKQSDKLTLGEFSNQIYKEAVDFLISSYNGNNLKIEKNISNNDPDLAFYFSEKNKATVLIEALTGQEAMKFANIPDSLLQKEQNLRTDISFYTKQLSESDKLDSVKSKLFQDRLFLRNRSYDSLIMVFEKQFPEYHKLKYNNKPATVKDIQKLLDKKTSLISYVVGDSTLTIFILTKSNMEVQKLPKMTHLNDSIIMFRYGLIKTNLPKQEIYQRLGYKLYNQLIPKSALIDKKIKNFIIIPDEELALIPFESLLTTNYTGDINKYNEYPFLIKKYNISYSYSANLFFHTFSKKQSSTNEITKLNDWLAFTPVFDNKSEQNVMISMQLKRQLDSLKTDSLMANRSMFDRNYIRPLPETETETKAIFKLYDERNLKAKVLLGIDANEQVIKSGELSKYKVLHFATHAFVNSERPELSGLLLAQDTTGGEDGVLYSGEIYNLKLNSDLVVLSACETGLGKIQKGEGIIGLTRALLYAGTKNIVVSLWKVADKSTSDLMVDFYKNSLKNNGQLSYSEALQNAKLKMISTRKYAHPFFWSPFILIGK